MKNVLRSIAFLGIAVFLAAGCGYTIAPGAGVKVVSNIPYHTATVKVVNATHYTVTLLDDSGRNAQTIAPGQTAVHRFWNMDERSARFSLVATATDGEGKLIGAAEKRISVSGRSKQSESWILRKYNFR